MKKYNNVGLFLILIPILVFTGCGGIYDVGDTGGGTTYTGVAFAMIAVPLASGFPTGENDNSSGSVTSAYSIAETEVTDTTYTTPIQTVATTETGTYTIDFSEGSQDNPCVNPIAKGFRLPTSNEWGTGGAIYRR